MVRQGVAMRGGAKRGKVRHGIFNLQKGYIYEFT
jgi:hypothetical protein